MIIEKAAFRLLFLLLSLLLLLLLLLLLFHYHFLFRKQKSTYLFTLFWSIFRAGQFSRLKSL